MMGFRFLSSAEQEMTEAARYYEEEAEGLGLDFLNDVQRTIDRFCDNPNLGQTIDKSLCRGLFSRFPFSLIYAVDVDGLLIVAIAHQRRRPDYWKQRVKS